MNMTDILAAFSNEPLFSASERFLAHLGVKCSTQTELPIPFLDLYKEAVREANAAVPKDVEGIFSRVENTYFIGMVTDDTLKGDKAAVDFKDEAKKPKYEGMFVFAVEVRPGESLSRGEVAVLVRGINRVVRQQPATVLILESPCGGTLLSIATCERTAYKQTWRPGERLGKVSILRQVNCLSPHRGHLAILESMDVKGCKTFDALYDKWQKVFSSKLLTDQFYMEIKYWYLWAQKPEHQVRFPNDLSNDSDNGEYINENLIRLITRLLFTWFMKEKGLVNPDLFDEEFLSGALRHFVPDMNGTAVETIPPESCTYYRAILQNLFFATFNQEIPLRRFTDNTVLDAKRHKIKNYYRNAKLFSESDERKIIGYFNGSPFVNGGLFECLDEVEQDGKTYSWDGFSNNLRYGDKGKHPAEWNGSLKSALIPDYLFFSNETIADLSEFIEDKRAKSIKVRGLVNILKDYVFTIEENTPLDEDVALDPELLGKVFENLLGCFNPETRKMARNATGSFYTPREIVNYMVSESLKAYLAGKCPDVKDEELAALLRNDGTPTSELSSVQAHAREILQALFHARILDPACGSGAFPMGIMSAIVDVLRRLDPGNKIWYDIVLRESLREAESVASTADAHEREELKRQIELDFDSRVDHPDYARKLYVIENCVFGGDIQPIAVQISRLRFFITLLCEQAKNEDPAENYGITPLPNLESNFVAANSLISLDLNGMRDMLEDETILALVKRLREVRHQLFLPKTSDRKRALINRDDKLREDIAAAADRLYDSKLREHIALLEKETARIDAELAALSDNERKDSIEITEEKDLWGNTEQKRIVIPSKEKSLLQCKRDVEGKIHDIQNDSRKQVILDNLKKLVKWNPFAFNRAESFLDPEWMFDVKGGFDIVIGNPPYVIVPSDDVLKPYYIAHYAVAHGGKRNLYHLFFERGILLCKEGGSLSYITPDTFFSGNDTSALRKFFLDNVRIKNIVHYTEKDKVFENVTQAVAISVMIRGELPKPFWIQTKAGKDYIDPADLNSDNGYIFKGKNPIVSRMKLQNRTFGDVCKGFKGDVNLGLKKAYFTKESTDDCLPLIRGIQVSFYSFFGSNEWCHAEAETRGHRHMERVVFQEVANAGLAHRIKGTIMNDVILGDSLNYVYPTAEGVSNRLILAVLNSLAVNYYFKFFNQTNHVPIGEFLKIPFPNGVEAQREFLETKVDAILAAKKADPAADTSALEEDIDNLVFDLYDLTPEEREIVKGSGK